MNLLTTGILQSLPELGSTPDVLDPVVHVKFFTPDAGWTWYVTEGGRENDDVIFFGFVVGMCPEWGYFSLSELKQIRGKLGLPVERDLYFEPRQFSQIKEVRQ